MSVIVREACGSGGPCAVLGTLVSETSTRYIYRRRPDGPIAFACKRWPALISSRASRAPITRRRATATCGKTPLHAGQVVSAKPPQYLSALSWFAGITPARGRVPHSPRAEWVALYSIGWSSGHPLQWPTSWRSMISDVNPRALSSSSGNI